MAPSSLNTLSAMSTSSRRHPLFLLAALALAALTANAQPRAEGNPMPTPPATPAAPDTVIQDVTVFDGQAFHPRRSVLIHQGRITYPYRGKPAAGVRVVRCEGCTLMPGLIDSHVHAYQQFDLPLHFGVTTQLDMFTSWPAVQALRERMKAGTNHDAADLYTAGTLVTAPGGHGTEYGFEIPTLTRPQDAEAFVAERVREGSDYIKIVLDDGHAFQMRFGTLDQATVQAVVRAAHARGKLAVVHVSDLASARMALEAGADGLVHLMVDEGVDDELIRLLRRNRAFVIPTWTVYEGFRGGLGGQQLSQDPAIAPLLTPGQVATLGTRMSPKDQSAALHQRFQDSVRRLRAAGIPILAGTDAGNPGTLHGASLHRELTLLASAGLTPAQALAAATSQPAKAFRLPDRGRIANGLKADLLLVQGDPRQDIRATRQVVEVWKDGHSQAGARQARLAQVAAAVEALARTRAALGLQMVRFSATEEGVKAESPFGSWGLSSDLMMKGQSTVNWRMVQDASSPADGQPDGQAHDRQVLQVSGELKPGAPVTWAGIAYYPAPTPFQPHDLAPAKGLRITLRTHGDTVTLQLFSQLGRFTPVMKPLRTGEGWETLEIPFASLEGFTPSEATALLFVASGKPRTFQFEVAGIEWLR